MRSSEIICFSRVLVRAVARILACDCIFVDPSGLNLETHTVELLNSSLRMRYLHTTSRQGGVARGVRVYTPILFMCVEEIDRGRSMHLLS